jgi:hypothetical protein
MPRLIAPSQTKMPTPFSFLSSVFQRIKKMTTVTVEEQAPALTDHSIKTNGVGHKRRDLKTVVNYADQEAYLKLLAEAGGTFDLSQGPEVSVLCSVPPPLAKRCRYYPKAPPNIPRDVVVEDIGGREKEFTLEKNGFMIAKQTTKTITTSEDLTDNEKIKNEYYPEMEAWLKEV